MIGQLVSSYRLTHVLGRGGMGIVYAAEHKHIGKRAAVKVLLRELSSDPELVGRFFDEARAASMVDHPGIVQVFDCDFHPESGQAFIVMEFLDGLTLRETIG